MSKSIYVGNLPWSATEEQVQDIFAEYGSVLSVKLVSDRDTGRARGFGFVEMEDGDAINALPLLTARNMKAAPFASTRLSPKSPPPVAGKPTKFVCSKGRE